MAKVGQGDPRWVVKERNDGRNVNNWHWSERNISTWAHQRLSTLLLQPSSLPLDENEVCVERVAKVDGDVILYNRKGTLKVVYDLNVDAEWGVWKSGEFEEGKLKDKEGKWMKEKDKKEIRGRIGGGGFKFELFDDDPEVVVSIASDGGIQNLKRRVKEGLTERIRKDVVERFLKELWEGGDVGLEGLRFEKEAADSDGATNGLKEMHVSEFQRTVSKPTKGKVVSRERTTEDLVLRDRFLCSTGDLYLALTEPKRIEAYTRGPAKSEAVEGGRFEMRNGLVSGSYEELVANEKITMRWRMSKWPKEAEDSQIVVTIGEDEGKTELVMNQTGIPKEFKSETEGFWRAQIFQAIKVVLGYGSASFL